MRKTATAIALMLILLSSGSALAERDEMTAGLMGGLALPGWSPSSSTAFTLATWHIGTFFEYGLLDNLYLTADFLFMTFAGDAQNYKHNEYTGTLRSSVQVYQVEAGGKYKLYGGYNLAPYLLAKIGYNWSVVNSASLRDGDGNAYPCKISDFGQGGLTLTVGLSVDYRLLNMLFVGGGINFTYGPFNSLLKYYISVPVYVSYYW